VPGSIQQRDWGAFWWARQPSWDRYSELHYLHGKWQIKQQSGNLQTPQAL
jgi:hypothetical protein